MISYGKSYGTGDRVLFLDMEAQPGFPEPPTDGKALREAIKATIN